MAKTFSEMLYEKMNIRGVMQADLCRGLCSTTAMAGRFVQGAVFDNCDVKISAGGEAD